MGKTVNLNKNASALMGTATKVRIRVLDGTLQVRPTDRKSAVGLPKGELLADLRLKKQAVRALRFTIPSEVADAAGIGTNIQFLTETGKHGWIALRNATAEELAFYNTNRTAAEGKQSGGSISSK
jgi:hypothetical protein